MWRYGPAGWALSVGAPDLWWAAGGLWHAGLGRPCGVSGDGGGEVMRSVGGVAAKMLGGSASEADAADFGGGLSGRAGVGSGCGERFGASRVGLGSPRRAVEPLAERFGASRV